MHNAPGALTSLEANRRPHPETDSPARRLRRSAHAIEAIPEGRVTAYRNVEIACL